jgi:hypothetical protein
MKLVYCKKCKRSYCNNLLEHCPKCKEVLSNIYAYIPVEALTKKEDKINPVIVGLPKIEYYSSIWYFINNPILRYNIASRHLYLSYLIGYHDKVLTYGTIEKLIIEDILINIAHIAEAVLHGLLNGKSLYHKDKINKKVILSKKKIDKQTKFIDLITSATIHLTFFNKDYIKKINKLRLIRNRAHLSAFRKEAYKYYNYTSLQYFSLFFQDFINILQIEYLYL